MPARDWIRIVGLAGLVLWTGSGQNHTVRFRDVTMSALGGNASFAEQFDRGIGDWAERLDVISGIDVYGLNGVAAGDYDGDGWDDFFVCQPGGLPGRLFRNKGDGTFEDATKAAGLLMLDATASALFADYDNDGDRDLFLVRVAGVVLFENDGSGRFKPSARARFDVPPEDHGAMTMAAMADYDRDGFLDLYVCVYSRSASSMGKHLHQPTPYFDANNGPPNRLFRNNGDGTFSDVTQKTGLNVNNARWSFAAAWSDYDGDGDPDLYVANDFGRNNLYRNNGDGTFTDVAAQAGVEDIGPGMGVAWGDIDRDGRPDLYVANIWSAAGRRIMDSPDFQPGAPPRALEWMRRYARGNSLYRNRGDGTFEVPAAQEDTANGGWAWGSDFVDADNDGWEDLLVLNGHVTNQRKDDLESFHWTDVVGASPLEPVRSAKYADGWRRFQNLMTESGYSVHGREKNRFFRNTGNGRFTDLSAAAGLAFDDDGRAFAALDIDLDGDTDLILKNRTGPQVRLMRNDSTPAHQSVAFDLVGRRSNRDAIGARITFELAGSVWSKEVRAGSGFLSQHSRIVYFGLGSAGRLPRVRIGWPSGLSQEVRDVPAGAVIRIEEGESKFKVRPFRPSSEAVRQTAGLFTQPGEDRGIWLLDPVRMPLAITAGSPAAVTIRDGVAEIAVGRKTSSRSLAPPEQKLLNTVVKNLFAGRKDMTLPVTLLLDGAGRIVKIYRSAPNKQWIADDLRRLPRNQTERAQLALPFPAPYSLQTGNRLEPYFLIGYDLLQAGSLNEALAYFEECLKIDGKVAAIHSNAGAIHARQGQLQNALSSYRQAAQLDPASAEIQFNLGTTLAMAGRFPEAAAALERATRLDAGSAEAWANLGNVYLDLEKPDLARLPLERALQLRPSAFTHNSLGTLHFERGALAEAQRHFESAIRLKSDYDAAYINLGHVHLRLEQRPRALDLFRKALEVNPANTEARRLLEKYR